jgi:hypothetical protein
MSYKQLFFPFLKNIETYIIDHLGSIDDHLFGTKDFDELQMTNLCLKLKLK